MKEADGDLKEAAKIMQDLQVETYGSMERKEKVTGVLIISIHIFIYDIALFNIFAHCS